MKSFLLLAMSIATLTSATPVASDSAVGEPLSFDTPVPNYFEDRDDEDEEKLSKYQSTVLKTHNKYRAIHSAPKLKWSPVLAESARNLALKCVFKHDSPGPAKDYGQNLAAGTLYDKSNVADPIRGWYNEVSNYKDQYGKPTPDMSQFGSFGHFTQVVWVNSARVGCASVNCKKRGGLKDDKGNVLVGLDWFVACNYSPAGNYLGQFAENVKRPKN